MKRVINLDNWNRKEHFKFFSALDDPFLGNLLRLLIFTSVIIQNKGENYFLEVFFFVYSVATSN